MSYSLNSFKAVDIGDYIGTTIGLIKGDTRSLDNGPCDSSFVKDIRLYTALLGIPCEFERGHSVCRMLPTSDNATANHYPSYPHS